MVIMIFAVLIFSGGCVIHTQQDNGRSASRIKLMHIELNTNAQPFINGTYVRAVNENTEFIIDSAGTYSVQLGKHRSTGTYEIAPLNDSITLKTWGDLKDEEISFKGNSFKDPYDYEWIKKLSYDDVSGDYYGQENQKNHLNLNANGSYTNLFEDHEISGKYSIEHNKIILHDHYNGNEMELTCGSAIPGYGHSILSSKYVDFGVLVKSYDQHYAVAEYVHISDQSKTLTFYGDGFFFMRFEKRIINGIYVNYDEFIICVTGDPYLFRLGKNKSGLLVDGEQWIKKSF